MSKTLMLESRLFVTYRSWAEWAAGPSRAARTGRTRRMRRDGCMAMTLSAAPVTATRMDEYAPGVALRCLYTDLDGTLLGRNGNLFGDADGNFSRSQALMLEACH